MPHAVGESALPFVARDRLLVPVLFSRTATDYAIGEKGRALLAARRGG